MDPLFFSLGNLLQLMVIHDPETLSDGKPVLTSTYSVFQDMALRDPRQCKIKEAVLHSERKKDPEYYGFLSLESSGDFNAYTADGKNQLTDVEVKQLIDLIKA